MRLKELPVTERPRERLLEYGASSLANDELLSILLDTGKKGKNVKDLSLEVLQCCGNIHALQNITKDQLLSIDGIGVVKALKLLSAIELGKRIFLKLMNRKRCVFVILWIFTVMLGIGLLVNNKNIFTVFT